VIFDAYSPSHTPAYLTSAFYKGFQSMASGNIKGSLTRDLGSFSTPDTAVFLVLFRLFRISDATASPRTHQVPPTTAPKKTEKGRATYPIRASVPTVPHEYEPTLTQVVFYISRPGASVQHTGIQPPESNIPQVQTYRQRRRARVCRRGRLKRLRHVAREHQCAGDRG